METVKRIACIKNPNGIPVRVLPNSTVMLLEDVLFDVTEMCGVSVCVDVPKGFHCDGASIPRILWSIVGHPLEGGPLRAAIVHDWLCAQSRTRSERRFADTCFAWILEEMQVPRLRRVAMHLAVRLYATFFWRPRR